MEWQSFCFGAAAGGLAVIFLIGAYLFWVPSDGNDDEEIY